MDLVSKLLGNVIVIYNEQDIEKVYATNQFNLLGNAIINNFYHKLYSEKKRKKNQIYFLSDWKKDNETLVHILSSDESIFAEYLGSFLIDWLIECNLLELASQKKRIKKYYLS